MTTFALSIVIGIRNWGLDRLDLTLRAIRESTIGSAIDIVVSDCGSENRDEVEEVALRHGAQYLFVEAELWSRSLALNHGIAIARSDFILTSDADFIFTPKSLEIVAERLKADPNSVIVFQLSDLPEAYRVETIVDFDWDGMRAAANMRPCWGMGCAAFTRDTFDLVRGYEERMIVWGAEDNDFVKRARAVGRGIVWIDHPDAQVMHIWHPPFLQAYPDAQAIFAANRKILIEDETVVRNLGVDFLSRKVQPTVSIVVATHNRAHLVSPMIESCLAQTFRDFELIIIDDASTDDTREVVRGYQDPRIRYLRLKQQRGVGRARNVGNQIARGAYIAVHDDDDIMVPRRLEYQLAALRAGDAGCYGGWIDFNEATGTIEINHGKTPFTIETMLYNSKVLLHPTLLLRRDVYLRYNYCESFAGGSDYNFMVRMAQDGLSLNHCGQFLILRRFHDANLTVTTNGTQKVASKVTTSALLAHMNDTEEKASRAVARAATGPAPIQVDNANVEDILRLLPDSLVHHWLELPLELLNASGIGGTDNVPMLIDFAATNGQLTFTKASMSISSGQRLLGELLAAAAHRAMPRRGTNLSNPALGGPANSGDNLEDLAFHRLEATTVIVADFVCDEADVARKLGQVVLDGDVGTLIRRGNNMWSLLTRPANDPSTAGRLTALGGSVRRVAATPAKTA